MVSSFFGDPLEIHCIFAAGEDKGSAPSSRRRQRSSALHLDLSNLLI